MNTTTCQYTNRSCVAPRSLKASGEPHRLCDAHRRWHARHRLALASPTDHVVQNAKRPRIKKTTTLRRRDGQAHASAADRIELAYSSRQMVTSVGLLSMSSPPSLDDDDRLTLPERGHLRVTARVRILAVSFHPEPALAPQNWVLEGPPTVTTMPSISL